MHLELALIASTGRVLKELLEILSNSGYTLYMEYGTQEGKNTLWIRPHGILKSVDKTHVEAIIILTNDALRIIDVHSISILKVVENEVKYDYADRQGLIEGNDLSILMQISGDPLTTEDFI